MKKISEKKFVVLDTNDWKTLTKLVSTLNDDTIELIEKVHEQQYGLLTLTVSLLCDLFEALKMNPLDKSETLRRYLTYHHLGMVSDLPGYKVLNGRLINESGFDETDERFFNGEEDGKSYYQIEREIFENEYENEP